MLANNRSVFEEGCPVDFQKKFEDTVSNWVALYDQYEDFEDKTELFKFLSLAARDIGKEYYIIAHNHIEMYKMGMVDIPSEIGCALCDLSNDMQRHLFDLLISEVTNDVLLISILSKALWHNEQFVYNIDSDLLLNVYFPKAVKYIGKSLHKSKGERILKEDFDNVKYCLEYILGIMRLRNLNDATITDKYLSLNNPEMKKLYKYLEMMADNNTRFFSFLKLEITSKGSYNKICDLLYALFVYVTGNNTEGEIRISLNIDE